MAVRDALARLEPPPRLVDWSILALVLAEVASGLYSFTVGSPSGWYVVWGHRAAGLTLLFLIGFKLARVRSRLTDPGRWRRSTALSVGLAAVALAALATGIAWGWLGLVWVAHWPLLAVHAGLGLLVVPLVLAHVATRFRPPRRTDFRERRVALNYTALLVGGALAARGSDAAARLTGAAGRDRRFTGSKPTGGAGNAAFPVTSWVADDPDPIDRDAWSLTVTGRVAEPREFGYDALAAAGADDDRVGGADDDADGPLAADAERALLDCTSGWYTVQDWTGVRVGDLLAAAGVRGDARYVRFVSVTGYRWSLPVDEARDALLATAVGGEPLSHGHGAPARLVAPDRRGFQWVKWVDRVEVRRRGDPAQWLVTLISGFG